ncbi:MAG TPA: PKD domain-containing protein [Methanoregulaceae archaeon]|nr:PKD domain-containing protein [Methanoregulaceae archaeon]
MNHRKVLQISIPILVCLCLMLPATGAITVTDIDPSTGINADGYVFINEVTGTDFPGAPGAASVLLNRAGEDNITAPWVNYVSPTWLTCAFDLDGAEAGQWNVVVRNTTSGEEGVYANGFTVTNPAPTLTDITPDSGYIGSTYEDVELTGTNFLTDGTPGVNLTLAGEENITAMNVQVDPSTTLITLDLDLAGAQPGDYTVILESQDGQSAELTEKFSVSYPPPEVDSPITPDTGTNDGVVGITNLQGSNFRAGANVTFSMGVYEITPVDGLIITPTKIMCFMDLTGAKVGKWNVTVTNEDGKSDTIEDAFTIFYPHAPGVDEIDPDFGYNNGTVDISAITGSGFEDGATVVLKKGIDEIPATDVTVQNSGLINCTFDLTGVETGLWNIVVENDDGQAGMLADGFTVMDVPPQIDTITPDSGSNNLIFIVLVSGSNFDTPTIALARDGCDDIPGAITMWTVDEILCTVDLKRAEEVGFWDVVVTNDDGQSDTLADRFEVTYPAPTVYAIDPATGENTGNQTVDISGHHFRDGATVALNRTPYADIPGMDVEVDPSGDQLTCIFDLAGAEAGDWDVVVTNDDGQSDRYDGFSITNIAPTVDSITPDTGSNDGDIGITNLAGTGFLHNATVLLQKDGADDIVASGVDVTSPTKIQCFFNLTGQPVGKWDVVVTNNDGKSGMRAEIFTVQYPTAPDVTSVTPETGVRGTEAFEISDIAGTGFRNGASVVLQKDAAEIVATGVWVSPPDQIACTVNLSGAAVGFWDIVVTNDDGQTDTYADGFEVIYPAPTVTDITPDVGLNNEIFYISNLTGTGFRDEATVTFNMTGQADFDATNVTVVDPTKITCDVDLNGVAVGDWNVIVTNEDGQSSAPLVGGFTVEYPAPTVSSPITPSFGPNDREIEITSIPGTGFRDGAAVALTKTGYADIVATDVNVLDSTTINCTVNLTGRALGSWNVVVTNTDDGKSGMLANGFEILPPPPVAAFSVEPAVGTVPLTVQFTDQSTNNPVVWVWVFGDGSTSAGQNNQNPVHTYNEPGVYDVSLRVINDGGSDQVTIPGAVTVVTTPVASFYGEPTEGTAPLLVQFTDTSDGNPKKWLWQFGDGSYSFQQNPYHLYRNPGIYTVKLTVTNSAGSDTVTMTDYIVVTSLPVADFSANRTSGVVPMAVQFTDKTTGTPTSWAWSFGDGSTSTDQNPVHVYTVKGTYSVQLTATNNEGVSTKTKPGYIRVGQGLAADFEYEPSNPDNIAPLTVAFTDMSTGNPLRWTWRFGDGYVSTDRNPIHTFQNPGSYDVTLTVTGMEGSVSATKTIEVVPVPLSADFTAEPTTGSAPLTVEFTDTSTGTPNEWTWVIYKDTSSAVVINPGSPNQFYTFNEPGMYSVQLIVSDDFGDIKEKIKPGYINVLEFP